MTKTRKIGKRRNLIKKHESRRYAKGKKDEISFLLKTMLNDVHTRTYGRPFYDPGNPSVVSHIVAHFLPSEKDRQLEKRVAHLEKQVAQRKQELILERVQAHEDFLNKKTERGDYNIYCTKDGRIRYKVMDLRIEIDEGKKKYGPPRSNYDIYYEWWDTLFTRVDILYTNADSNEAYAFDNFFFYFDK
jgi:hypothetical protein